MPIAYNVKSFSVFVCLLAILAAATVVTVRPHRLTNQPVTQSDLIELNLNLTAASPQKRAESARRLGNIAIQSLAQPTATPAEGASPAEINKRLQSALETESDPNTRAAIQSVITQLRDAELVSGAVNPLSQRFK